MLRRSLHRRIKRNALLLVGLFALVACQMAASAMACAPLPAETAVGGSSDCHAGPDEGATPAAATCPTVDKVPDWGKLPVFQSSPSGADFPLEHGRRDIIPGWPLGAWPRGQAPPLAASCRLLI